MCDQFIGDILEELFKRGLEIPCKSALADYIDCEHPDCGDGPIDEKLVERVIRKFKLTTFDSEFQCEISTTAGAVRRWLAIHEAGHAIVGLELGLLLTGVRFFPFRAEGPAGVAVLHNPVETDEATILRLISVDLAGNIAQLLFHDCEPPIGGRLSHLCREFSLQIQYPTDFLAANSNADKFMTPIRQCKDSVLISTHLKQRRPLFEKAEKRAEEILRSRFSSLRSLATELVAGPLTGTEVNGILARE